MRDAASWSVRELKRYLHSNGINTNTFKQKEELIELVQNLLYEDQKAEWIRNVITLFVICITVLILNVYIRPKMEKIFWLNPKWAISWIIVHLITLLEKLLTINIILSWILPATLKEYNFIDKYLIKNIQLFPLSIPLNYDAQTQNASMWIDLYPMLLIYLLRKLKNYVTMYYHYMWYDKYRPNYYIHLNNNNNIDNNHNDDDNNNNNNNINDGQQINNIDDDIMDTIHFMDDEEDDDDEFNVELQDALLASMEENDGNNSNQ